MRFMSVLFMAGVGRPFFPSSLPSRVVFRFYYTCHFGNIAFGTWNALLPPIASPLRVISETLPLRSALRTVDIRRKKTQQPVSAKPLSSWSLLRGVSPGAVADMSVADMSCCYVATLLCSL